jgi:hypothetical protein
MNLLKSVIISEMANLLMEVDKRHTLAKFGFNEKLQNAFHEMDNKVSPWFASIIANQYAKENNIKGNNLAELVKQIDQDDLMIFLRQKKPFLNYIKDWIKSPRRPQNINLQSYRDLDAAHKGADDFHREIERVATGQIEDETGEVIKVYPDYYWIDLKCNSSRAEGDAMGHCGADSNATTMYSLRDKVTKEPHVTIAIDERNRMVRQVKGKQNKRPVEKYMTYVVDILQEYFRNGKLKGFEWSLWHNIPGQPQLAEPDFTIDDIKRLFPDRIDFMNIVLNSPSYVNQSDISDEDIRHFLMNYIDYDNINFANFEQMKQRVNRVLPTQQKYKQKFIETHNALVWDNVKEDRDNVIVAMLMLKLPKQFVLNDIVTRFGLTMNDFKEVVRNAPSEQIFLLMNEMETGFIYPLTSGRNLSPEELYTIISKMNNFEDRPEYRERFWELIGDKINVLKNTEYAQRLAREIPDITKEFPLAKNVIPNNNISEIVSEEIDEAGSLFNDFLKRNSSNKISKSQPVSKKGTTGSAPEPSQSSVPDVFDKYNRFANKVTGVNLDKKRVGLIHALDQKQPQFFQFLKSNLQGFDVKPKERNVYMENRTYDYTITSKRHPLVIEHMISIVPKEGFYNIRYHSKVYVDESKHDTATIDNLLKYKKSPQVEITRENGFLIYKLPFQKASMTDHAPFQDVNKLLGEVGQAFVNKIKVFNNEIVKSFKQAY